MVDGGAEWSVVVRVASISLWLQIKSRISGVVVHWRFCRENKPIKKFTKIIDPMKSTNSSIQVFKYSSKYKVSSIQEFLV